MTKRATRVLSGRAIPLEHESQAAFFEWWAMYSQAHGIPDQLCFAVPNGSLRHPSVALKLKKEGVKSGVSDVFLMVPAAGFHALLMEFKRKGERPTPKQEKFLYETRRRGYNAVVVYSTEEAIRIVTLYLSKPQDWGLKQP